MGWVSKHTYRQYKSSVQAKSDTPMQKSARPMDGWLAKSLPWTDIVITGRGMYCGFVEVRAAFSEGYVGNPYDGLPVFVQPLGQAQQSCFIVNTNCLHVWKNLPMILEDDRQNCANWVPFVSMVFSSMTPTLILQNQWFWMELGLVKVTSVVDILVGSIE